MIPNAPFVFCALAVCFTIAGAGDRVTANTQGQSPSTPALQTPTLHAGVDLIQLDVSVLDKDRQPVRGLTQSDFTVLENGVPRSIDAFVPVDLPDATATTLTAAWLRDVTPDVTTNALPDTGRVFVIVLDDGLMPDDLGAIEIARKTAERIVTGMGPKDLAAVVFTMVGRAQGLTSDRTKLLRAVNSLSRMGNTLLGVQRPEKPPPPPPTCSNYTSSVQVVADAAKYLAALRGRRKSVVYISGGMGVDIGLARITGPIQGGVETRVSCGATVVGILHDVFTNAATAGVSVYGVDPMGLRTDAHLGSPSGQVVEYLQTISDNTGGHAIVNTNDAGPGIAQIFRENSSYYLLGYKPVDTKADGSIRRIEVKVDRPGVEVVSRRLYYAPKAVSSTAPPPSVTLAALSEIVPKSDWPMRVAVMPVANGASPVAAIAIGVERPAPHDRVSDSVELVIKAFTPDGEARGSFAETVPVVLPPSRPGDSVTPYDLLAPLPLKPGPYELRISAHSTATGTSGSVYADVEIPDFAKAPLSLSGIFVTAAPGETAAPRLVFNALMPVVPTSERRFATTDRVSTRVRVYQPGRDPQAVTLAIRIVDAHDQAIATSRVPLAGPAFAGRGFLDVPYSVPTARLVPGEYLLTFETSLGRTTARRDVRFTMR